jgi:hypothetical protein
MKRVAIGLIMAVALVAVAAVAFLAGTRVGASRVVQNPAELLQRRAMGRGGQFPAMPHTPGQEQGAAETMFGGTMGTIEGVDGGALVISTDEGTIRVHTTDTTLIEKYVSVNPGDLEIGERVVVSGSRNDDGSLTARSIRSMRGFQFLQSD